MRTLQQTGWDGPLLKGCPQGLVTTAVKDEQAQKLSGFPEGYIFCSCWPVRKKKVKFLWLVAFWRSVSRRCGEEADVLVSDCGLCPAACILLNLVEMAFVVYLYLLSLRRGIPSWGMRRDSGVSIGGFYKPVGNADFILNHVFKAVIRHRWHAINRTYLNCTAQ